LRPQIRVRERGDLRGERAVVEHRELLDLADQLVDLLADAARRELRAVRRETRKEPGRNLVVGRVLQRLEVGLRRLDSYREVSHLLHLADVVTDEVAALQL